MLKILLIAYACEPGKGSEQGTGWNLAVRLAKHHKVTVVTRANNEEVIKSALEKSQELRLSFLYHDLGSRWLQLKRKKFFPVQLYYALWQYSLFHRFDRENTIADFDLVHYLTFNSFEIPPMFRAKPDVFKVWGPIGGGQIAPAKLTTILKAGARWKERLRGWRVKLSRRNPLVRSALATCDLVLFANNETRDLLKGECRGRTGMMVDVGVDPKQFRRGKKGSGNSVLFAGKFEPRKGVRLLLKSFELALKKNENLLLTMVGDGPEWEREKEWIQSKGLENSIEMAGRYSHSEMSQAFAKTDIFVFPSLRDTTGAIALEAMACEVPTICLNHQGARLMVDNESGMRIPISSESETVKAMANALVGLSEDEARRKKLGENARQRVELEFSWESKTRRILQEYERLSKKPLR